MDFNFILFFKIAFVSLKPCKCIVIISKLSSNVNPTHFGVLTHIPLTDLFDACSALNIRTFVVTTTIFTYIFCNFLPSVAVTSLSKKGINRLQEISLSPDWDNGLPPTANQLPTFFPCFSLGLLHPLVSSFLLVTDEFEPIQTLLLLPSLKLQPFPYSFHLLQKCWFYCFLAFLIQLLKSRQLHSIAVRFDDHCRDFLCLRKVNLLHYADARSISPWFSSSLDESSLVLLLAACEFSPLLHITWCYHHHLPFAVSPFFPPLHALFSSFLPLHVSLLLILATSHVPNIATSFSNRSTSNCFLCSFTRGSRRYAFSTIVCSFFHLHSHPL